MNPGLMKCHAGSPWDASLRERLSVLWEAGLSAKQIAIELGLSKNAVIGKAHRMNLESRPSPIIRRPKMPVSGLGRTCQWIENDPTIDPTKCGQPVRSPGESYCEHHHAVCWVKPTPGYKAKNEERAAA